MKVAVLFDFLGPYHRARLDAAAQTLEVAAIEVCEHSAEYAWVRPQEGTRYRLVPLMTQSPTNGSSEPGLRGRVFAALDDLWPDAVKESRRSGFHLLHDHGRDASGSLDDSP